MAEVTNWEYAQLAYARQGDGEAGHVAFTHKAEPLEVPAGTLLHTVRELGDLGWEMVSAHHGASEVVLWFKRPQL
jgi:hypothetical protein